MLGLGVVRIMDFTDFYRIIMIMVALHVLPWPRGDIMLKLASKNSHGTLKTRSGSVSTC